MPTLKGGDGRALSCAGSQRAAVCPSVSQRRRALLRSAAAVGLLIVAMSSGCARPPDPLQVMSYNIRYDTPNDAGNAWPHRKDGVSALVRFYDPDVIGFQEALEHQVRDLAAGLPGYAWYGVGREDGRTAGEYSPIFYRADRFDRLAAGTLWLSETPDSVGSVGWDAALERIASWLQLRDRRSGREVFVYNTHWDHRGATARLKSAELLVRDMRSRCGSSPLVLLGDLNCTPGSPPHSALAASQLIIDAKVASTRPHAGPDGTFSGFEIKPREPRTIDYIFVRTGITVIRHAVIADQLDQRQLSDHRPVFAEITLP